ncbi:MAG: hypothetical protein OEM19_03725 [Deltaproteobacteria bacterium]|nr:hypothetical protein [Deltaproteobacteria bacterium]
MRKANILIAVVIGTFLIVSPVHAQQGQEEGSGGMKGTMHMKGGMKEGGMMGKEGMMKGGGMMHHGGMMHGGKMMGHCGCTMMDMESRMERHFEMCMKNAEKLGLSEKQMADLKSIHNEKRKKLIRLQSEIQILNIDLKDEVDKPVPDMAKVEQILRKQETLKTDFALEAIKTRVEVSKILTEEQFKKMHEMMKEMMEVSEGMGGM